MAKKKGKKKNEREEKEEETKEEGYNRATQTGLIGGRFGALTRLGF